MIQGKSNNPVLGKPDQWFDPSSFEVEPGKTCPCQPFGFYGNLGRNTLSGPHSVDVDFSVIKNMGLSERLRLQFRAEAFNVINHASFGTPPSEPFDASGVLIPTVGRITSTDDARQVQFGLKFSW